MGMECSLSREVIGWNWHAEQLFNKEFGNQGTGPAKGYQERPSEPCCLLELPGWMFLQDRGKS